MNPENADRILFTGRANMKELIQFIKNKIDESRAGGSEGEHRIFEAFGALDFAFSSGIISEDIYNDLFKQISIAWIYNIS